MIMKATQRMSRCLGCMPLPSGRQTGHASLYLISFLSHSASTIFFGIDDDSLGMQYSIMLPYDFWKADGKNPRHLRSGAESSMLEARAKAHQDNNSSFYGIMLDKIHVGPLP